MPVYNPLVPTGTVNLNVDYQNLQGNFEQANIVYGTDHYPFDNATAGEQGFHDKATFPVRSDPTTIAAQGIVYTKDSAVAPGRSDLYYAYQTDVGTPFSGTFFPLTVCKAFGKANAAGLIAGTGFNITSAALVANTWTIDLTSAASDTTDKIMVFVTSTSASTGQYLAVSIVTTSQFTVLRPSASHTSISFMVLAI